jgi:serine protease Do
VETTGSIDTYLEAYDASRTLFAEDDDGGNNGNAKLDVFAESGRTYLFKLRGYDKDEAGPYSIRAIFEAAPADEGNTQRSRAVLLKHDDSIPVLFRSGSESRWYRYDLPRQRNLLIIRTIGSLDTYLKLYDSQGNLVAENDDSGEGANALLSEKLGPGTYYIELTLYESKTGRTTIQAENWYRD